MRWLPSALFRRARCPRPQLPRKTYRPLLEALEDRLAPTAGLAYPTGFASAGSLLAVNGSAKVYGSNLELTDGGNREAGSVFTSSPVAVTQFTTRFPISTLECERRRIHVHDPGRRSARARRPGRLPRIHARDTGNAGHYSTAWPSGSTSTTTNREPTTRPDYLLTECPRAPVRSTWAMPGSTCTTGTAST